METPAVTQPELWRRRLHRFRSHGRSFALFAAGIGAAMAAMLLYTAAFPDPTPLTLREVDESVAAALASATPPPSYSSLVYGAIQPSLVLIETEGKDGDDEPTGGLGTGLVIDLAGNILTSLHVVEGATTITLTFADGTESSAQVIVAQPENDTAVLQASRLPELLVPAILGNPHAMRIGDEAFAVGHPLGLYGSMSSGVISGLNRTFRPPDGERRLAGLIQFDAAVNPGNSGGPLLNRAGQVIGIVTGLANPTEQEVFIGIGFAVPIDVAGGAAGLPPY
jgi:S1-C subfamily serine protease